MRRYAQETLPTRPAQSHTTRFAASFAPVPSLKPSLKPHTPQQTPQSPIHDFYPVKFEIDMEGKRAEWEGIVKIPFISEDRLLAAARSVRQEQ